MDDDPPKGVKEVKKTETRSQGLSLGTLRGLFRRHRRRGLGPDRDDHAGRKRKAPRMAIGSVNSAEFFCHGLSIDTFFLTIGHPLLVQPIGKDRRLV